MTDAMEARLFIGLELSDEVRRALAGIRRELSQAVSGRLYEPDLYHVTLCFLGQVPRRAIPHLGAVMDRIAFEPFELKIGELGTFKNGSILWAGVEEPCTELYYIQGSLCDALKTGGFSVEDGKYTPHITLGRQIKLLDDLPDGPVAEMTVGHMTLFESTRVHGKLAYVPLYRSGKRI